MAATKARPAAKTRKTTRRAAAIRHTSTPNITNSRTKSAVLCGSSIAASKPREPQDDALHDVVVERATAWTSPCLQHRPPTVGWFHPYGVLPARPDTSVFAAGLGRPGARACPGPHAVAPERNPGSFGIRKIAGRTGPATRTA